MRAISGDDASTNLAVNIHIIGEEKVEEEAAGDSFAGILIGVLSLLVLLLLVTLVFTGVRLKESGYFDDEEFYDEIEEVVESMSSDEGSSQSSG